MNIHKNARLTPRRREDMARAVIDGACSKADAARIYGVTSKVVTRWTARFLADGTAGMADRSSRPRRSPRRTATNIAGEIAVLRRQRLTGKHIAKQTACRRQRRRRASQLSADNCQDLSVTLTLTANFRRRQSTPPAIPR
ncbi:UNVERIFIED_ORG: transposase-like protein [Rhizobium esperanzae]|nr:IS481 family insertion sequence transposase domain-containing protein [Rhizobium phaseoli]ANM01196.1 IS481 family insertion sequence transposase domain-containing protein [Rhizobium phaseoli]